MNNKEKNLQDLKRKEKTFLQHSNVRQSAESSKRYNSVLESPEYALAYKKINERIFPNFNIRNPSTFAKYGNAKKYYENSYKNIHNSYPYDGSGLEKINWSLSASAVDLAILQHEYPLETGHVTFCSSGWGTVSATDGRYSLPSNPEYIKFSGGPYANTVIDSNTNRESSLKIDPSSGNTLEFWMKKSNFESTLTQNEVIFDSYTIDFPEGNNSHGRFLLELAPNEGSSGKSPFFFTYLSGNVGLDRVRIGEGLNNSAVADGKFHHYAISVDYRENSIYVDFYVDGFFNSKNVVSSVPSFGPVEGYFEGALGALATPKDSLGGLGYGKLSASLDEVRFWKTKRNAEEIGNYYDFPVHGATDEENISSNLGIYYKFNEGTVGNTNTDKIILDYSGRLNNGTFVGYAATARSADSAITLSDATQQKEPGDPIINPLNPKVKSTLNELVDLAFSYDLNNSNSIMNSLPTWTREKTSNSVSNDSDFEILMQVVAERFDSIWMIIDQLPSIGFTQYRDFVYGKASIDHRRNFSCLVGCEKDFVHASHGLNSFDNFSVQNLMGRGFSVDEMPLVNKSSLNEYFNNLRLDQYDQSSNQFSNLLYSKIDAIKDKILNSVYVNLSNIYKTKGTFQSFRNLMRCFGVDERLLIPNIYGQNVEKDISASKGKNYESLEIKSFSFSNKNRAATLVPKSNSSEEKKFIEGQSTPVEYTIETKAILPKLTDITLTQTTSSIFGIRDVQSPSGLASSVNTAGVTVESVKSSGTNKGAYFMLKSKAGLFADIKTEYFKDVFNNTPWYLAVKFCEDEDLSFQKANTSTVKKYKVEFSGYRYDTDVLLQSFNHSASISQANYNTFSAKHKGVYCGAERANLTGDVVQNAESRMLYLNFWTSKISEDDSKIHAQNIKSVGLSNPMDYNLPKEDRQTQLDTLAFSWQFDNPTRSSTTYSIQDASGGSLDKISEYGNINGAKYPAETIGVVDVGSFSDTEHITTVTEYQIDNLKSESMVELKEREVDRFLLSSRPVTYLFTYEKSMYQVISKEMLNMIGGVIAYNKLIGEPINKYRPEYKNLEKLRDKFFANVENDISLERFVRYFKWIDSSLGSMLESLQPATSQMDMTLKDIVESHSLERNKYKHQLPQFDYKDPDLEGQILAINELLYDWEHGHAPVGGSFAEGARASATITTTGNPSNNEEFTLTDGDLLSVTYIFKTAVSTVDGSKDSGKVIIGIKNATGHAASVGDRMRAALIASDLNATVEEVSAGVMKLTQNTKGSNGNTEIDMSSVTTVTATNFSGGITPADESDNCLWWRDRAERTEALSITGAPNSLREEIRTKTNNISVSGSTYVLRKLIRPYIFTSDRQRVYNLGSNRNSNKNKQLYKVVNTGKNIEIEKTDIFEFKQCGDIIDPHSEKIYTAKTNTTGTKGYLDADADMIFPFTLYSSSVGSDFSNFKEKMIITNNHDDHTESLQSAWAFSHNGMPHRRVKVGTPPGDDRPEAYNIDATASKFIISQASGPRSIASIGPTPSSAYHIGNIKTNRESIPIVLGNYDKVYEIVQTHGRHLNNRYLTKSGSFDITPITPSRVYGSTDYTPVERFRSEHVFVNRFSALGAPENSGMYTRDLETEEYSIYNTINYRNQLVRGISNLLSAEYSEKFGYRTLPVALAATGTITTTGNPGNNEEFTLTDADGLSVIYIFKTGVATVDGSKDSGKVIIGLNGASGHAPSVGDRIRAAISASDLNVTVEEVSGGVMKLTQNTKGSSGNTEIDMSSVATTTSTNFSSGRDLTMASTHMTNRNYFHYTASGGELSRPDNFFVQHPIPQNDFSYSWITASAEDDKHSFVNRNDGFGHEHNFHTSSKPGITFLSSSQRVENLDFARTNFNIIDNVLTGSNFISSSLNTYNLNDILLNRNGPYGWPTWKQLRNSWNPLVIKHMRNNIYSRTFYGIEDEDFEGQQPFSAQSKTPSMNAMMNMPNFAREFHNSDDPYVASTEVNKREDLISRSGPAQRRVSVNYKENPLTDRFRAASITIHNALRPNPDFEQRIVAQAQLLEFGLNVDPNDPNSFPIMDTAPIAIQQIRNSRWWSDALYYESLDESDENVDLSYSISPLERQRTRISDPESYLQNVTIRKTFQNDISMFSNMQIQIDQNLKDRIENSNFFDFISQLEVENQIKDNKLIEVNYIEKIYPREINTFTKNVRTREYFDYFPWKSARTNRNIVLTGSVSYSSDFAALRLASLKAFPRITVESGDKKKTTYLERYDAVDVSHIGSKTGPVVEDRISGSAWPLDSRKDFSQQPTNIASGFVNTGPGFIKSRDQATRHEGILQNDFSTWPLGYNGLYGTPPFSLVYNRRIPQEHSSKVLLSGEAMWEAATSSHSPFHYDNYVDYAHHDIRLVGQDHSIVPEFRISEFVEDILLGERDYPNIGNDYLSLTGAIYHNSSGDLNVGGQFFKTYSNSDFLKYFKDYDEEIADLPFSHTRINFRCVAAMKFIPYDGLYPAERTVKLATMFSENYLPQRTLLGAEFRENALADVDVSKTYLSLRANSCKYQASKPFFGPGVLYNSIKAGVAVDYPVFQASFANVSNLPAAAPLRDYSALNLNSGVAFTGSILNSTKDCGIPRIKSTVTKRIEFEDILSPARLHGELIYDNEPHPSASLIYGNKHWEKIIERPTSFGRFNLDQLVRTLGIVHRNPEEDFAMQMAPYTMAMQNFASETVNFFVDNGKLTTMVSKPVNRFFKQGTNHKMRVYLTNVETMMYDRHSAFGPPVHDGSTSKTNVQNTSAGTAESTTITFNNPATFSLNTITSEDNLPRITIVDGLDNSAEVFLFENGTSAGTNTTNRIFIDTSSASAADVAASMRTFLLASSLDVTATVNGSGAITIALASPGKSISNSVALRNGNLGSAGTITVSNSGAVDITNNSSFGFSGDVAGTQFSTSVKFSTSLVNAKSGLSALCPASAAAYPSLKVVDEASNQKTIRFYNSAAGGPCTHGEPTVSNVIYIDLDGISGSSSIANEVITALTGQGLGMTFAAGSNPGEVVFTLSGVGTPSNAELIAANGALNDGSNNRVIADSSITAFSGTPVGTGTEQIQFRAASVYFSELEKINIAANLPKIVITDHAGTSRTYKFRASTRSYAAETGTTFFAVTSSWTAPQVASNFASTVNTDISGGNINLATTGVSTDTVTLTLNVAGASTSDAIVVSDGTVPGTIVTGGSVIAESNPGFSVGNDPDSSDFANDSTVDTDECTHGYMPYVPPFLDAGAEPYVEVTFTPSRSANYTAKEIIEECAFSYSNFKEQPSNPGQNTNYINSMSLSASLNLGMAVTLRTDNESYDYVKNPNTNLFEKQNIVPFAGDPNNKLSRWVIQSKWETPVLDFLNVTSSALDLDTNSVREVSGSPWKERYWDVYYKKNFERQNQTSGNFLTSSTGMWHQKGEVVNTAALQEKQKGYFLRIEDVETGDSSGLATIMGFNEPVDEEEREQKSLNLPIAPETRNRIGPVEDKKLVKEAVVAIPYVFMKEKDDPVQFVNFRPGFYRMALESRERKITDLNNLLLSNQVSTREEVAAQRRLYQILESSPMSDSPVNAIEYQLNMMDEFVLPPQLDFRVTGESPYMMYFFQFHAEFDIDDVSNVWQNLSPVSAGSTASPRYTSSSKSFNNRDNTTLFDVSYVSHYLDTVELNGLELSPVSDYRSLFSPDSGAKHETRWLIFKVKQRAEHNFEKIRLKSIDSRIHNIEGGIQYIKSSKDSKINQEQLKNVPGLQDGHLHFNWPYDYFSFVELIKLETKIDTFNNRQK